MARDQPVPFTSSTQHAFQTINDETEDPDSHVRVIVAIVCREL